MIQEKKCKGQTQASGFPGCGKLTDVSRRKWGLCQSCKIEFLTTTDKGKILVEKATLKATSPRIKAQKDLEKAFVDKKARTSLGALKEQTQRLVNKYVKLRDVGKPCASSLIPYTKDQDAGHVFPVKGYEGLRYDLDNIHGQSINANRFLEGDHINYLINLPKRIGKERTQALIERAAEYKKNGYKFSRPELLEIQAEIKQKLKELKC